MAKNSKRRFLLAATVAAAGFVLAACPGTDRMTAPPGNQIVTDTLSAVVMATGSVVKGELTAVPAQAYPGADIQVGDLDGNINGTAVRGQIGFDLSGLPQGIQIQGAELTAQQCAVNGFPFTGGLGNVIIRHMTYAVPFDTTVFFKQALDSTVDTLTTTTALGIRSLIVTNMVTSDIAVGRPASQFQLQMSDEDVNGDGVSDNVVFAADSANTFDCTPVGGQQPRLIITYHKPS
jgi:hypothetical protein